jgi:hypothetical protein
MTKARVQWPAPVSRPFPPDLDGGACVTGDHPHPGATWTDGHDQGRTLAVDVCLNFCPCLIECRAWGIESVTSADSTVIGGLTGAERRAARKAART